MPRGSQSREPGSDDNHIRLRRLRRDLLFDRRGDPEVHVTMRNEEGVRRIEEGLAVGRDRRGKALLGEPIEDVLAPFRDDVVTDEDVVDLLDAADGGDDAGLDLLLGEGVSGEASGEGGEGLGGGLLVDDDDLLGDVGSGGGDFRQVLRGIGVAGQRRRGEGRERGGGVKGRELGGLAADAGARALALALERDLELES